MHLFVSRNAKLFETFKVLKKVYVNYACYPELIIFQKCSGESLQILTMIIEKREKRLFSDM